MSINVYLGYTRVYADVMNQAKSGVMLANADFPNLHSRSAVIGIHILKDGEENGKAYPFGELPREILNHETEANVSRSLK